MKVLLVILIMATLIANRALSQEAREAEIRRLDNLERESVLKGDSAALYDKLWSSSMIVNTPANVAGTVQGTKAHLRAGGLAYKSFERTIDMIRVYDQVAVVIGGEVIKPQGKQPNSGKTVTRRFTHVWMLKDGMWSIIARQATIIKVE